MLLSHNIIPHFHHNEMSQQAHEEDHKNADNLWDWLKLAFHNDLGDGHLEAFSESDPLSLDTLIDWTPTPNSPFVPALSLTFPPKEGTNSSPSLIAYWYPPIIAPLTKTTPFRGPPTNLV